LSRNTKKNTRQHLKILTSLLKYETFRKKYVEYTDSTGVAHPAYDKKRISKTAYQALDIANV